MCARRFTGSISKGRNARYRYYHCYSPKCKARFKAEELEESYEKHLENINILPGAFELFKLVLEDENIFTIKKSLMQEREFLYREFAREEDFMLRARKFLINEKIDHQDFVSLKNDQKAKLSVLNERLVEINQKISKNKIALENEYLSFNPDILHSYKNQDISSNRQIINLLQPTSINSITRSLAPLKIVPALSQIVTYSPSK